MGGSVKEIAVSHGLDVTTMAGRVTVTGHADGSGTAATFLNPQDVTTDGSNLYITDSWNDTIRRLAIAIEAVTTIAGQGVPGYADGPGATAMFRKTAGITTDGTNLYVTDAGNGTIRQIH